MANSGPYPGSSEGLSRRDLLYGGVTASFMTALFSGCGDSQSESTTAGAAIETVDLTVAGMPKGFSKEEMMRRWSQLRKRMKDAGFDCLIVPGQGNGADVRWLTGSSANWVVFPYEGQVTSIFRTERSAESAAGKDDLGIEMRAQRLRRSEVLIDRLGELGMSQARIGVGSLVGVLRNDEGSVSYTALDRIGKAFPRATFDSAADLLMRVKLVLGPEEIEVMKTVSRVSELGIQAMIESARPGALHREVWFNIFKTLLNASGELPGRVAIRAGNEANTSGGRPLDEVLQAGQIMNQEISGRVLGYSSQVNHSICIGAPEPADWASACQYCIDLYHSLVDWITPGKSFQAFGEFYRQKVEERGEGYWGSVFHTGALGDGPRMGPTRPDETQDLVIESGMVFTLKPRVPIKGVEAPAAQIGDPVLVTETGAQRLGQRELEVITVGV